MSGRKAKQARKECSPAPQRRRLLTERRLAYAAAPVAIVVAVVGGFAIAHKRSGASADALSALPGAVDRTSGRAPSLHGRNPITGRQVSLAQFAGRPVVVNVWGVVVHRLQPGGC